MKRLQVGFTAIVAILAMSFTMASKTNFLKTHLQAPPVNCAPFSVEPPLGVCITTIQTVPFPEECTFTNGDYCCSDVRECVEGDPNYDPTKPKFFILANYFRQ